MDVSTTAIIGQRLLRGQLSAVAIREVEPDAWLHQRHAESGDEHAAFDQESDGHRSDGHWSDGHWDDSHQHHDTGHRHASRPLAHTPVPWIPPTSITEEVDVALGFVRAAPHETNARVTGSTTQGRALERAIEKYREFS